LPATEKSNKWLLLTYVNVGNTATKSLTSLPEYGWLRCAIKQILILRHTEAAGALRAENCRQISAEAIWTAETAAREAEST